MVQCASAWFYVVLDASKSLRAGMPEGQSLYLLMFLGFLYIYTLFIYKVHIRVSIYRKKNVKRRVEWVLIPYCYKHVQVPCLKCFCLEISVENINRISISIPGVPLRILLTAWSQCRGSLVHATGPDVSHGVDQSDFAASLVLK